MTSIRLQFTALSCCAVLLGACGSSGSGSPSSTGGTGGSISSAAPPAPGVTLSGAPAGSGTPLLDAQGRGSGAAGTIRTSSGKISLWLTCSGSTGQAVASVNDYSATVQCSTAGGMVSFTGVTHDRAPVTVDTAAATSWRVQVFQTT